MPAALKGFLFSVSRIEPSGVLHNSTRRAAYLVLPRYDTYCGIDGRYIIYIGHRRSRRLNGSC